MRVDVEVIGDDSLINYLRDVGQRAARPQRPLEQIADDFERLAASAFGGSPSLVDTEKLRDSLTQSSHRDAVRRVTHDEMIRGTSVFYARFHAERLLEPIDNEAVARKWLDDLEDWLERGTFGGGFGL